MNATSLADEVDLELKHLDNAVYQGWISVKTKSHKLVTESVVDIAIIIITITITRMKSYLVKVIMKHLAEELVSLRCVSPIAHNFIVGPDIMISYCTNIRR